MGAEVVAGKVGLVGAGMVGSSFAYALIQSHIASELVLIDADGARAEGEAMDLDHGIPFAGAMKVRAGGYEDLDGAALVVLAGGVNQKPGESRLDLLQKNAAVFREVVPRVVAAAPRAIILVATNPVDLLATLAAEIAGLPRGRVLGSGTILDTARFKSLLGEHYSVSPASVHAMILGEHGDSEVPAWSLANVAGIPLRDFVGPNGRGHDPEALTALFERVRTAAYEIIRRKKATYYAIGLGLRTIAEAILRDQKAVLTVCSPLEGELGVGGLALSLPTVVGRDGAEKVLAPPLAADELDAFRQSADVLKERYAALGPD